MRFLTTDRLVLRNVKQDDAEIMFDYRNNELCSRYQRGQTKDLEGIRTLVSRRMNDTLSLDSPCLIAVALKNSDEMVGEIVVMPSEGTICLGYTFSYRYHRRGYAFESLSALIDFLHDKYPTWDFVCFTDSENAASMALLKKLGYTDYGYLPSNDSRVFGKWLNAESEDEIRRAIGI